MKNRISLLVSLSITAMVIFSLALTSCSGSKKSDEGDAAASEDGSASSDMSADAQIEASSGDTAATASPEAANEAALDSIDQATTPETKETDLGAGTTADATTPPPQTEAPPATDTTTAATTDSGSSDLFGTGAAATEAPKKKASGPYQHIKDVPFEKGGTLLNTVYLAREGDTMSSVSQKLFNEDKSKDLKKANPALKNKLRVGDKLYFNSPVRPDDKDKVLVVYEDQGLPPTTYTTKEGDTLKSLAQEWFGKEDYWKEIYAINRNIASSKDLPAGTELRYWPQTVALTAYAPATPAADVAQAEAPVPPPAAEMAPPAPPPAAAEVAQNAAPPPPPAAEQQAPPPPPADNLQPPPPPPKPAKKAKMDAGMDKDILMVAAVGVAAILLAVAVGLIRRSRARKANTQITQV